MHTISREIIALICCFVVGCCSNQCIAQVVRLKVYGSDGGGRATAFSIGQTEAGASVFLTARHNFRDATGGQIEWKGSWYKVTQLNSHPTEDVCSFEADVSVSSIPLAAKAETGVEVLIPGFGPEYHGRKASAFRGVMQTDLVLGNDGLHPIPGDSGAPVIQHEREVIAVVNGYRTPYRQTAYRSERSDERLATVVTGLDAIHECLQQCYQQCPPGGCKIWIRNEYRQPIGFLGLPAGPPQRVQVAEPVPRVFVPEDQPRQYQPPPMASQGPPGPAGPQGPPGHDGRSVTMNEVEAAVNAWLDANREQLVGPRGPAGPPGPAGSSGGTANVTHLESRLTALEQRPFRIVLSADGKIVDDETYPAGQPVVLDLRRLRSVSDGN